MSVPNTQVSRTATATLQRQNETSQKKKVEAVQIDDPTTWTIEFCRKMSAAIPPHNGGGDMHSRWIRRARELEKYQDQKAQGEDVSHPLARNNCKGARSVLLFLSQKEIKIALDFPNVT